ncbi:hypothetical protein SAMN05216267_1006182 [Actinacidiphila rubida]|uniref:Uncharacterized protein n=1 Tax=Actinacidiphila rubida TaxID=310780 RepID=A0A1H8HCU4_9ACTN|nr:hypothetical protein SAMN05216267_1006182 [Actinacidiphila rubida]
MVAPPPARGESRTGGANRGPEGYLRKPMFW